MHAHCDWDCHSSAEGARSSDDAAAPAAQRRGTRSGLTRTAGDMATTVALLLVALLLVLPSACAGQSPPAVQLVVARRTPLSDPHRSAVQLLDRAQADRFTALHPHISVRFEDFPSSSSVALRLMTEQLWRPASAAIDVYGLDATWAGDVAPYFADLRPLLDENVTDRFRTQLVEQNTVKGGKIVALPRSANYGVLLYRRDLLSKYNYTSPPRTYEELERMARRIVAAEEAASAAEQLVGYTFQGDSYEGLTCNALEWIAAAGGGSILERVDDESSGGVGSGTGTVPPSSLRITVNNPHTVRVLERARAWVRGGGISPRSVMAMTEDESFRQFSRGRAVFSRQWVQALAQLAGSPVQGLYGVAYLPGDEVAGTGSQAQGQWGGGGAVVGGSSIGVVEASEHKAAAALYIDFVTSVSEQERSARQRSHRPVLAPALFNASSLCDPFSPAPSQCDVPAPRLVERPWTLAAPHYTALSATFYRAVSEVLAGGGGPVSESVATLECDLALIVGATVERCAARRRSAALVVRKESTVMALLALSAAAAGLIILVVAPFLLRFRKNRVIHHSSLSFCLICLLGLLLIVLSVFVTNLQVRVANLHCYLRVPLFNLGFMLSFGALFLKSYALHKVFNNPVLARIQARVDLLYASLGGLVALDATIIALWFGLSPFTLDSSDPSMSGSAAAAVTSGYVCPSPYTSTFNGLLMSSKGVFLLCGSYYTYKVRAIPSSYNESKYIGLVIFTSTLLGGLCMTLTLGLGAALSSADLLSLENGFMLLGAFVALLLLFGSKAVLMLQAQRESHIAAASTLNAAFGMGAARLSVTTSKPCSSSSGARRSMTAATALDTLSLSDATALPRLQAHLLADRTALLTLMHTTARYTNMIEEAKCRVEAQLQLIGKRIGEYRYHLAHNKSAAEQTNLINLCEYITSLSPSFSVASNRVTLSMGQAPPGEEYSNNVAHSVVGSVGPSSPSQGPRPLLSRATSAGGGGGSVSGPGGGGGGGGGGGASPPTLTRAKSYTASRVVNTGTPLPRTNSHVALRRSHTQASSSSPAGPAATGAQGGGSGPNSGAPSPRTTQRRSHVPPPSSARSSHSYNGAGGALPLGTLLETGSVAGGPALGVDQVELVTMSPCRDQNASAPPLQPQQQQGPSAFPIPSATSSPLGSPYTGYWRAGYTPGASAPVSPLLLATPSSPCVYVYEDAAAGAGAGAAAGSGIASPSASRAGGMGMGMGSVASSRSHPRLSSLDEMVRVTLAPRLLGAVSGLDQPDCSPRSGSSASGSGGGHHRRSVSNVDTSSVASSAASAAQSHRDPGDQRSDSTPASLASSRRVSLLPLGYAATGQPPLASSSSFSSSSNSSAYLSSRTPDHLPAHESAASFSQRMHRSLRTLTAAAAARSGGCGTTVRPVSLYMPSSSPTATATATCTSPLSSPSASSTPAPMHHPNFTNTPSPPPPSWS